MLSDVHKQFLLGLKQSDITRDLIEDNLAFHYDADAKKVVPPKFKWSDEFSLKKGQCHNDKDIPKTNVGLFIINKFLIEDLLEKVLGYWNETITDDVLGKMEAKICEALETDVITTEDYAEYQNRLQWILSLHTIVCGSFTKGIAGPMKSIISKRDKLTKENKDAIDNGDAVAALKIEKELIEDAKKELKNDPGMELFDSGARGNFNNNYKSISIQKGPVFDPISGKYKIATTSFSEGIKKDNIPVMASSIVQGAYP